MSDKNEEKKVSQKAHTLTFAPTLVDGQIVGGKVDFESPEPTFGDKAFVAGITATAFGGALYLGAKTFETTVDGVQKIQRGVNGEFAV